MRNPRDWITVVMLICAPALSAAGSDEQQARTPGIGARALRTSTVSSVPSPQAVNTPASFSLSLEEDLELGRFVFKDGYPLLHTEGAYVYGNTALGLNALISVNPTNSTGLFNTALGAGALRNNTDGFGNTGVGIGVLGLNVDGDANTAVGSYALYHNTYGFNNVGIGSYALLDNTVGERNTAIGTGALFNNVDGMKNTATGSRSLYLNLSGDSNTAIGYRALFDNTSSFNTAIGLEAAEDITSGSSNTAVGRSAGSAWTTGNNNIGIGVGSTGEVGESGVIRIGGLNNQTTTFIEGISDGQVVGNPVCITASDELGLCPAINVSSGLSQISPQLWEQLRRQDAELAELRKLVADQRRRLEELERHR